VKTSLEQSMAIQVWLTDGMDRASERISEIHAFDTDLCIDQTRSHSVAELGDFNPTGSDEAWMACVLRPFRGDFSGVAILSMDPDEAFAWVLADGPKKDIVGAFIELGGLVVEGLVAAGREIVGSSLEPGPARFREDSVTGCLVGTHAPSDTVAVGCVLKVRAGGRDLEARLHVLMEPKSMGALLQALSVSLH